MSPLKTPAERLRAARESAGYPTARAFWSRHGIPQATYQNHETGARSIRPHQAEKYAKVLEISLSWLLTGEGDSPLIADDTLATPRMTTICELDIRADAGPGALEPGIGLSDETVDEWKVPTAVLRAHTSATKNDLRIIRVYGDSMQPLFRPGDRVLVDISDRTPSPPGVFIIWDGLGTVIKRLEFVPYSDPKAVRLSAINPAYDAYTRPLSEVVVNGRVIARWDWT